MASHVLKVQLRNYSLTHLVEQGQQIYGPITTQLELSLTAASVSKCLFRRYQLLTNCCGLFTSTSLRGLATRGLFRNANILLTPGIRH